MALFRAYTYIYINTNAQNNDFVEQSRTVEQLLGDFTSAFLHFRMEENKKIVKLPP